MEEKYRDFTLPLHEIRSLTWKRNLLPIASFPVRDGERYDLLIFSKGRFVKAFERLKNGEPSA